MANEFLHMTSMVALFRMHIILYTKLDELALLYTYQHYFALGTQLLHIVIISSVRLFTINRFWRLMTDFIISVTCACAFLSGNSQLC